jgi:glycosyltransferase A (GT-A) superfamily protein (DUF2064 family)
MKSPGKIMTGLAESIGRRSAPDLHRADHARCSSAQMAAVIEGLVSVGVVIIDE